VSVVIERSVLTAAQHTELAEKYLVASDAAASTAHGILALIGYTREAVYLLGKLTAHLPDEPTPTVADRKLAAAELIERLAIGEEDVRRERILGSLMAHSVLPWLPAGDIGRVALEVTESSPDQHAKVVEALALLEITT
jgi:hypothetical protein